MIENNNEKWLLEEKLAINAGQNKPVNVFVEFIENQRRRFTEEGIIPEIGTVYYSKDSLSRGEKHLPGNAITSQELAQARMHGIPNQRLFSSRNLSGESVKDSFSDLASYVDEGVVYIPKENKILLVRPGALSLYNRTMNKAHKNGAELCLGKDAEKWYNELASRGDKLVLKVADNQVPVKRFSEDETIQWLFGTAASEYGHFLQDKGFEIFRINLKDFLAGQNVPAYLRRLVMTDIKKNSQIGIFGSELTHIPEYGIRTIERTEKAQEAYLRLLGQR